MTYAPVTIKELGAYWTAQGGVNLGIVGDVAHTTTGVSYHLGADHLRKDAYSATLPRDKAGLSDAASALDLGRLDDSLAKLYQFSEWLVGRCRDRAPVTGDVREVIYWSVANQRVQRWNYDNVVRWGDGQGDLSHKTHTHISFFRDSEYRDKVELFRPYFEEDVVRLVAWEVPKLARLRAAAVLYDNPSFADSPNNLINLDQKLPDGTAREFLYLGTAGSTAAMIAYEATEPDPNGSSVIYYAKPTDIASSRPLQAPAPVDPDAALEAKVAELTADLASCGEALVACNTKVAAAQGAGEALAAAAAAIQKAKEALA